MAQQDSTFSLAKVFEERTREIDAERRSAQGASPADATFENEPICHHVIEAGGKPAFIVEMQGKKLLRSLAADSAEGMEILQHTQPDALLSSVIPPEPGAVIEGSLSAAQEIAAVSGRVDPEQLLPKELSDDDRRSVLSGLAPQCTVETHQGTVQWLLTKAVRNTVLRRLIDSDRLKTLLDGPLPATDSFGEQLRSLLREGAGLKTENLDREQLRNLIAAMDATRDCGLPQPDVVDVRRKLGQREFLSEYDVLLARGFVGRQHELDELNQFVSNSDLLSPPVAWTSLVLTGLGGSGKSTLLAKFARDVFQKQLATVVVLDFDRPGIDARDFYWMEQEISRQVGNQYPNASEFLRTRRSEERSFRREYVDTVTRSSADATEEERSSRSIMSDVVNALANAGAGNRPFLLVLDTYEQIEEQDLSIKVFDWLHEIASYLLNTPLKVIFSGRLYDNNLELLKQQSPSTVVDVAELSAGEAQQVLLQNGIPAPTAKRLVSSEVLPLRPLELTLLARITKDLDKTIDELEDELREGGSAARELFAGLVYRRVLRRLQDPTAQRLAYPGLVLRFVTADLIRNVLGPALNLPPFDEDSARKAFEALASCNWLVSRKQDEVWHRSDLRRSTLKAMMARERDSAKRISDEAIKYFESQPDARLQAEAVYHRLLWMDDPEQGNDFQIAELKKANDYIAANTGDLPSAAASLLKFAVEGKVPSIEVECLPKRYLETGYVAAGKELIQQRLFGKALKLFDRHRAGNPIPSASDLEDWEVDTLFATASWDRLNFSSSKVEKSRDEMKLDSIARMLYPMQLISPERLAGYPLGKLLEFVTANEPALQVALRGAEGQETLRRLAIGMIYAVARGESDDALRETIKRIAIYRSATDRQPLAPVTERRLTLLQSAITREPAQFKFSINTLQLNAEWVGNFRDYLNRNSKDAAHPNNLLGLLTDLTSALDRPAAMGTPIRSVLGAIDSLSKEEGSKRGTELSVSSENTRAEEALRFLRGPSPEFRDPCRFALLEAFPDRASRLELAEIMRSIIKLDTPDLQPEMFADTITANPEQGLAPYVEFVDRAWALGKLVEQATQHVVCHKLELVSSAYKRWDEALTTTINSGFSPGEVSTASSSF